MLLSLKEVFKKQTNHTHTQKTTLNAEHGNRKLVRGMRTNSQRKKSRAILMLQLTGSRVEA